MKLTKAIRAEFARRGGKARAKKLKAARRLEIAQQGATARWKGHQKADKATA